MTIAITFSPARYYTVLLGLLAFAAPAVGFADRQVRTAGRPDAGECVVLLHGLARTHRSMNKIAAALESAGYRTFNMAYRSRGFPIEELVEQVIPASIRQCAAAGCDTIHFVTHSMGGILLRSYLSRRSIERLGRVVMLSPPNQGSEVVDTLRNNWFFKWYNGPAGQQLGTGPDGIAAALGPVTYPVGIITGNTHSFFDSWLSDLIPGEDDGKVSVQRAKVEGMKAFLVLPYSHPFIMNQEEVIGQTLYFLRTGTFRTP